MLEQIPNGIKVIGKEAFCGNLKIKKTPEYPPTLERIEDRAFMKCPRLRTIVLPSSSVKYVGADVFLDTVPNRAIYYHIGNPCASGWNPDYNVIRRFANGKVVRLRPKRGR